MILISDDTIKDVNLNESVLNEIVCVGSNDGGGKAGMWFFLQILRFFRKTANSIHKSTRSNQNPPMTVSSMLR